MKLIKLKSNLNKLLLILLLLSTYSFFVFSQTLYDFRRFKVILEKFKYDKSVHNIVMINLDGTGLFKRTYKAGKSELIQKKEFDVSVDQLEYIYYVLMKNRFLEISGDIGDPSIQQGYVVRLTAVFDRQTHQVTLYNENNLAVFKIMRAILRITPKEYARVFEDDYTGDIDKIELE
ncbi:MAG: hypothetical protein ACLFQV_02905 [Vulcanimicrobiota bacterium]